MRRRVLVAALVLMTIASWYTAYRVVRLAISIARELSNADQLAHVVPRAQTTLVVDRYGRPAFAFYAERRIDVPLEQVSPHMVAAIVAVEDRRFYSHYGLDPIRIVGAGLNNLRAGRIVEGGSTITQQLARAAQLTPVRTFERKFREAMLAVCLEERYSKAQILEEYLNTVYFGEGFYGIEAASRGYFGKPAETLDTAEAALLAGLVRAPSHDSPWSSVERAFKRRNLVLRLMRRQGFLTDAQFADAVTSPIPRSTHQRASILSAAAATSGAYYREEVRRQLVSMFGTDRVLRGGLRVYSTYDPELQKAAELAIRSRIDQIASSRRRARDLQGSLVAIDPLSGGVLALVGGRDFSESPFNRATQARRQAGSAFKPIIYAAALERGYTPGSMLIDLDTPIYASGETWLPSGEHEGNEYTLRGALNVSSNRAAAQLLQQVGIGTAISYARRLGIESQLPSVPSLALGTGEVTLLELTAAYGAFANRGVLASPHLITRVEDADGTPIWVEPGARTQAVTPTTAFLMSSMLADVVSRGTAYGTRSAGFSLPAAGKTGTTDDYADAWFVGYTPHLVAGVWFGLDQRAPIMDRGFAGVVAVPAWARFMKRATEGDRPDWYEVPSDVEKVAICRKSGARATPECRLAVDLQVVEPPILLAQYPDPALQPVQPLPATPPPPPVYEDYFPIGAVPPGLCPLHRLETSPDIRLPETLSVPMPQTAQRSRSGLPSKFGTGGD